MLHRYTWALILTVSSLILGLLMAGPQILHKSSPLYQGISIPVNSDEAVYLARVEESLTGRPEQASRAFTGHPGLVGSQVAFIEAWYGRIFRWTGWNAATVLDFMDIVIPILLFLSLFLFFRFAGFSHWLSFGGASAFCLLQLYNLGRPIHMRSSFLLMLWSFIGISLATRSWRTAASRLYTWSGILLGGVLLGLLVGVYFWSFTFAWAFWGVYMAWELLEWGYGTWQKHKKRSRVRRILHTAWGMLWHFRPRRPSFLFQKWHMLIIIGVIGVISALPAVSHFYAMMHHSMYEYASFRSGMHPGRLPESLPYSLLFLGMILSLFAVLLQEYDAVRPYRSAFVMAFATFIYMHQNVLHGVTFNFVSHGIFSLATAAILVVLLGVQLRSRALTVGVVCAVIYLLAIGYDGRYVLKQWTVRDDQYIDQHLSEVIAKLETMPRSRILSDPQTSAVIAGYTHHDVVYSVYLKNILMSHGELATRYCLTQIFVPPSKRDIANTHHLIFPDASAAFGQEVRKEEVRLVENACRELDLDPATALQVFEVDYVLWNRKRAPDWDFKRIPATPETVASGEDWVLMKVDTHSGRPSP